MSKLDQFQQILTKEMNRKEFLQHIGVFIVGAIGITAFTNQFLKLGNHQPAKQVGSSQPNGYGARSYGR